MSVLDLGREFTFVAIDISDVVVHLGDVPPHARRVQELAQRMIDEQVSERFGYQVTRVEMVTGDRTIRPKKTCLFKMVWVDEAEG